MPDPTHPHRWRRIAVLIAGFAIVEFALMVLARLVPAMSGLMKPAYAIVAAVALLLIVRSSRGREGSDRRQDERRDGPEDETEPEPGERTGANT